MAEQKKKFLKLQFDIGDEVFYIDTHDTSIKKAKIKKIKIEAGGRAVYFKYILDVTYPYTDFEFEPFMLFETKDAVFEALNLPF